MPTFYNFTENGLINSFDNIFVPADLFREGNLWTWGSGNEGKLGTNDIITKSTPVTTFTGGTNWKQVSSSYNTTAAIKTNGTLWVWGSGWRGRLGNGNTQISLLASTPITTFAGGTDWKQVSNGYYHTAAIKTDGTLWTWGGGYAGQLGNFAATNRSTPVTTFAGGTNWKQVSCNGYSTTAAIKTDGTLWTWGGGTYGQLGNNSTTTRSTPVTTRLGGTNWKQVSAGGEHTAAIKTDGTLWIWGRGDSGQLGNNSKINGSTPVTTFSGGTDWKQVSCADDNTTAVKTDGTLWSWGNSIDGQLGRFTEVRTPVTTFAGGTNWADTPTTAPEDLYTLSAGSVHTAAIKTDGTLWTWGNGGDGRLGNLVTVGTISTPVTTFSGGTNWKQVSCADDHTAAIKTDGTLWTWGKSNAQLGRVEDFTYRLTPITTFAGGTNWADTPTTAPEDLYTINAGYYHTAAIKTDGTLWVWGSGNQGRLGNADDTVRSTPVTTFAGRTDWKQVSSGNFHTAAIKTDGTLWTWGLATFGRLATNDMIDKSTPVTTFAGGNDWKQVSCSNYHTAAIKTDGTLWTWGNGLTARLGNNDLTDRSTPVTTFTGGTNWKQVSAGDQHTAAIKTDGTLWTWGNSTDGQLGRLTALSFKLTPVTTFAGGTNWADTPTTAPEDLYTLSAGYKHSAAIKTDGTLWTWGYGVEGQLGNFDTINKYTPITTFAGGTNWKQVSSGGYHTAAIKTDGTLWTWGSGNDGQLGNNSTTKRSTPVTTFAGGTDWKQVSCGGYCHTIAIKTDGTLWSWGNGSLGRHGNNNAAAINTLTPITTFSGGTNWKQVSAGKQHVAAIKTDGTLWVWGSNSNGKLGTFNITNQYTPVTTFAGGTDWKQASAGFDNTVAIKTDGTLWTWGFRGENGTNDADDKSTPITTFAGGTNWKQCSDGSWGHTAAVKTDGTLWIWGGSKYKGELGNNNDQVFVSTPVTTFAGGNNWKQVSCGLDHTMALKDDGVNKELYVWGNDFFGNLGINFNYIVPDKVEGTNWKQVNAGYRHTAAIKTDGTLWTWGSGTSGRLGTNDSTTRSTPVTTFAGGTDWKQVSAGGIHSAAVKTDGTLWTWGSGGSGRLGTNVETTRSTPVTTFAGGTNWKQVSCGLEFTMALKDDGVNKELYGWGRNETLQLGNNSDFITNDFPVTTFAGGTDWKQVSSGANHTAAVKTDGTLWTWGYGSFGRLGIYGFSSQLTPITTFSGGTNWKQVSSGYIHTAAVKTDGTLWIWGSGDNGRLGINDTNTKDTPVTTFAGGTNWKQVSAGELHTTAIKTDGTLWTWGSGGFGQLGNTSITDRSTPVTTFAGGTDWKQVSAGELHTTAIKTDGTLWTWGYGQFGQLGNSSLINRSTPVTTFAGGTNWKQVSAGSNFTMALKDNGVNKELYLFGLNGNGEIGNGNITGSRSTPVQVFGSFTNWKQVSSGYSYASAIKTDGTLWTWGNGGSGRLGTNDTTTRFTPVTTFAGGTNWKQISSGGSHTAAVIYDDPVI